MDSDSRLMLERKTRRPPKPERLVCLNFKVPLWVRQRMKLHALQNNVTMTALLLRILAETRIVGDDCLTHDSENSCKDP